MKNIEKRKSYVKSRVSILNTEIFISKKNYRKSARVKYWWTALLIIFLSA